MPAERAPAAASARSAPWPVHITSMRRRHLRTVLRIDAQQAQQGWSLGLYLAELRRGEGRQYLVAKVGPQVVGFVGVLYVADDAHITTIAVDEAWRGRRIATRLLLVAARAAVARGLANLTLEVRARNEPALALYRRFGLAPAGIRKNYYVDIGEDALIMWATDIDALSYSARLDRIEAGLAPPTVLEGLEP